jgi:hypothetical protein
MQLKRKSPTTVRLTESQQSAIAEICAETKLPRNRIVKAAIDLYLADRAAT